MPAIGTENNSYGLGHYNSTSNLQPYNDLFKLSDKSCNLDYTNSSFSDGLSGLFMKDKNRIIQESNIATGKCLLPFKILYFKVISNCKQFNFTKFRLIIFLILMLILSLPSSKAILENLSLNFFKKLFFYSCIIFAAP